jgi:hypothetical protein
VPISGYRQPLSLRLVGTPGTPVPAEHFKPLLLQPEGDRQPHQAKSEEADFH